MKRASFSARRPGWMFSQRAISNHMRGIGSQVAASREAQYAAADARKPAKPFEIEAQKLREQRERIIRDETAESCAIPVMAVSTFQKLVAAHKRRDSRRSKIGAWVAAPYSNRSGAVVALRGTPLPVGPARAMCEPFYRAEAVGFDMQSVIAGLIPLEAVIDREHCLALGFAADLVKAGKIPAHEIDMRERALAVGFDRARVRAGAVTLQALEAAEANPPPF